MRQVQGADSYKEDQISGFWRRKRKTELNTS